MDKQHAVPPPAPGVSRCRICGNTHLVSVVNLGEQALTGVFPRQAADPVPQGRLELVACTAAGGPACGLVQLRESSPPEQMYGQNYGYRSGLNQAMVEHLRQTVAGLRAQVPVGPGDWVLDIGSNDGTLLGHYPAGGATLVGIDPTGAKFKRFYRSDIRQVPDFFSAAAWRAVAGTNRARLVTSLAMFYDLEAPLAFMREVAAVLAPDGLWLLEQSYLPAMLQQNAYDTICHEHVEYYALRQLSWMATQAGLVVVDVTFNDVNGGSFTVTLAPSTARQQPAQRARVAAAEAAEAAMGLATLAPYYDFAARIAQHRTDLLALLADLRAQGKKVVGYGASTKGNVILQYAGLTARDLACIAEVNPDKYGCVTPGSHIPIVSEADAKAMQPDYMLVLPWHFRPGIIAREAAFLRGGGKLIFPLPTIAIVGA